LHGELMRVTKTAANIMKVFMNEASAARIEFSSADNVIGEPVASALESKCSPALDARRRSTASYLASLALSTLVLLGLAEGVTRVFITSPSRQTFDQELGYRYVPGTVVFNGSEGGARHVVNSHGFLDDEVLAKGARPRLLIVGDSMTEGAQVERQDGYVANLRRMRPDLDIVSVAQSAAGPLEYRILAQYRKKVKADLVLFAFSTGDVEEVFKGNPEIVRTQSGTITDVRLRSTTRNRIKRILEPVLQHSALATFAARRLGRCLEGWSERLRLRALERSQPQDESEATAILAFLLKGASSEGPIAVTFLPDIDYSAQRRSRVAARSLKEEAVVTRASEQSGISIYNVDGDLIRQYADTGQPGHGFANSRMGTGHMNPRGHAYVARALAEMIPAIPSPNEIVSNAVQ
jgi:hypothetical protein